MNINETKRFSVANRLQSFRYAARGLGRLCSTQHSAWLHAFATIAVVLAGIALQVSIADWCWLVLAISLVWMAEAFNTALESLANAISPNYHPLIRDAKDMSAGAVLIAALAAAIIGSLVFWPQLVIALST
jgi:diacylglycerol kinase (ATP)